MILNGVPRRPCPRLANSENTHCLNKVATGPAASQVVLDMIMVSLRCTLVYKPRGTAKMEGITTPSRDLE